MALIADMVLDQALSYIQTNGVEVEIQDASDVALVDGVALDAGNYGTIANNTDPGGGRELECLVSDGGDMDGVAVGTAGTATKGAIKDGSGNVLIEADLSSNVDLTTSDQVNIGTIMVVLEDPS